MNAIKQGFILWANEHLIPDWSKALTFLSVKWNLLAGGFASVWLMLPDDAKSAVVGSALGALRIPTALVVLVVAALTVYFRLKAQPEKTGAAPVDPS